MILVTGGAGFIGSGIVRALAAAGRRVAVLDDLSGGDSANLPEGVTLVRADIREPAAADEIARLAPEAVVHAAAQVSVAASIEDPARDSAINVAGTANVLAGARRAGARRFVFLSSGGAIYGECDGATEQTLPRPVSYYGAHKYLAERYVEFSGLSHAVARLANVYGPGQRSDLEGGVIAIFLQRLRDEEPVTIHGDGLQRRDFIHLDDVVSAVQAMLNSAKSGTYNVGTGEATSMRELLRKTERAVGAPVSVRRAPSRAGDVRSSSLSAQALRTELGWGPRQDLEGWLGRAVGNGG